MFRATIQTISTRAPRLVMTVSLMLALLILLAGCENKTDTAAAHPRVRYTVIEGESVTLTRELPGRVSAFMVSEVRPQVSGIILERLFEEGADVEEGQVLYQIDPSLFQATYNNAKANLARAESNLVSARLLAQRYAKIVKEDAVSKQEYDNAVAAHGQAKAEVDAARAALETASINLGYTKVTAPVSGRIGRSFVTPGALVTQNQADPLSTVQQLDDVYVDVTQSNTELLRLRRALAEGRMRSGGPDSAKVKLKLEDGSPYALPGKGGEPEWIEGDLLFSDVTIEQSTGVVSLRARFKNTGNVLLPGMYVRAVIEEGIMDQAVLIPQKSLQRDTRGRSFVYVLGKDNPKAETELGGNQAELIGDDFYYVSQRYVQIGRDYNNQWLVESGLAPGDILLVDGLQRSRPGMLVAGSALPPPSYNLASSDKPSASPSRVSTEPSAPQTLPAAAAASSEQAAPSGPTGRTAAAAQTADSGAAAPSSAASVSALELPSVSGLGNEEQAG